MAWHGMSNEHRSNRAKNRFRLLLSDVHFSISKATSSFIFLPILIGTECDVDMSPLDVYSHFSFIRPINVVRCIIVGMVYIINIVSDKCIDALARPCPRPIAAIVISFSCFSQTVFFYYMYILYIIGNLQRDELYSAKMPNDLSNVQLERNCTAIPVKLLNL